MELAVTVKRVAMWAVCDYAGNVVKLFKYKERKKADKWLAAYNRKQDEGWGGFVQMVKC